VQPKVCENFLPIFHEEGGQEEGKGGGGKGRESGRRGERRRGERDFPTSSCQEQIAHKGKAGRGQNWREGEGQQRKEEQQKMIIQFDATGKKKKC